MSDEQLIENASKAFSDNNYELALSIITPLIESGNAAATGMLGLAYQHGAGVEQNSQEAIKYFQKAVELGDAYSAHNLARLYMKGTDDIEADNELSNIYYQLAEEMGLKYEPEKD